MKRTPWQPEPIGRLADSSPSDDAARPLYVTVQGAWIGVSGGRFEITKNKEKLASTMLIDVSQTCIYGNAQISTQALRAAFREEIPVCFFSYGGWFTGLAEGLPGKHVELRRRQVMATVRGDVPTAAAFVSGKIRNSRTLLRRNACDGIEEVTFDDAEDWSGCPPVTLAAEHAP